MSSLAVALHALAAAIWVGGMFFAYMALRPAVGTLARDQQLGLWALAFRRFFSWVWLGVVVLLATGYWLIFARFGGMGAAPLYVHLMQGAGILMMLIFAHVFFAPYKRLRRAYTANDTVAGARQLDTIRLLVAVNLALGLAVIALAVAGPTVPALT